MGCDPKEAALKSFFLGPQAENGPWLKFMIGGLLEDWFNWRRGRFPEDGRAISDGDMTLTEFQDCRKQFELCLDELISRFESEVPKFSPRYVGHMFSEISLPALIGHIAALVHNPNIISGESAKVGVEIEREALEALAAMLGFRGNSVNGHFSSGGTLANFEALVRARARLALWLGTKAQQRSEGIHNSSLFASAHCGWLSASSASANFQPASEWNLVEGNPYAVADRLERVFGTRYMGPVVLVPENRHYSWKKGVSLLGIGESALWPIDLDDRGRLSLFHLQSLLERAEVEQRPVLMVVSVAGSTELGAVDPVDQVQDLLDEYASRGIHIWHHVDAAYGGFFCSMDLKQSNLLGEDARAALAAIARSTSVTLDPHKLGYVPYSCGAFFCRDAADYVLRDFGAPYVQNTPKERGLFTLEGSRAATGAAATWMTARSIGLNPQGYGRILERTIRIRRSLEQALLKADSRIRVAPLADTNILAFTWAEDGAKLSTANAAAERICQALSPDGDGRFFVSKTRLSVQAYGAYLEKYLSQFTGEMDQTEMTVARVCVMNPFFGSVEMATDFEQDFVRTVISSALERTTP